jgi:hypothetical protein
MKEYAVYFNNDGELIEELVSAADADEARVKGQALHPDLQIITVKPQQK